MIDPPNVDLPVAKQVTRLAQRLVVKNSLNSIRWQVGQPWWTLLQHEEPIPNLLPKQDVATQCEVATNYQENDLGLDSIHWG